MSEYPVLPVSRSAMDKLGKRLAADERISDEDLAELQDVVTVYAELLELVTPRVAAVVDRVRSRLGIDLAAPTSRAKTIGTTHDKLRRQPGMGLKGMQDLAGVRVVGDMDRNEQDRVCEAIHAEFADEDRPPRRIDRREDPSYGYRAVHVIVYPGGSPVEIQVRTRGQQLWANVFERLADQWGRGIRYGAEPDDPDTPVHEKLPDITRRSLADMLHNISDRLDEVESTKAEMAERAHEMEILAEALSADGRDDERGYYDHLASEFHDAEQRYDEAHRAILELLSSLGSLTDELR